MFDDEMDPYPAYLVKYFVQVVDNEQRRPTCTINARDSRVIMSWDALETCVDCEALETCVDKHRGQRKNRENPIR